MPDLTDEIAFFIRMLEFIGTFAGAISGVRLASVKHFDWFGASVVGFITAVGGGTLRDVLLRVEPFWMSDPLYLVASALAVVSVGVFGRRFISGQITWFLFDTISISLFMVIGLHKAILNGYQSWCAIVLGVVTAVFGGTKCRSFSARNFMRAHVPPEDCSISFFPLSAWRVFTSATSSALCSYSSFARLRSNTTLGYLFLPVTERLSIATQGTTNPLVGDMSQHRDTTPLIQ